MYHEALHEREKGPPYIDQRPLAVRLEDGIQKLLDLRGFWGRFLLNRAGVFPEGDQGSTGVDLAAARFLVPLTHALNARWLEVLWRRYDRPINGREEPIEGKVSFFSCTLHHTQAEGKFAYS